MSFSIQSKLSPFLSSSLHWFKFYLIKRKKRTIKIYFVSYPAVAFAIIVAFLIMLGYYSMQHKFDIMFSTDSIQHTILKMVPSILYSFVVIPLNLIYKYLSIALTDWGMNLAQFDFNVFIIY